MAKIATLTPKGTNRQVLVHEVAYDFATHTGGTGTYESNSYLPKGAKILSVKQIVNTAFTSSGSATVALKLEAGSTDYTIIGATAFDNAAFATSQALAAALPNELEGNAYFIATIAGAAVTAGSYKWLIEYYL